MPAATTLGRTGCGSTNRVRNESVRKSPEHLGPAKIRPHLLYLAPEKHLAASSIIVAVSTLRFCNTVILKRSWIAKDDIPTVRQAKKLPVVMSSP